MENRGSTEDNSDEKKSRAEAAIWTGDLTEANIKQDDFPQEFSSDLPNMEATSTPSYTRSPPFPASQSPSLASKLDSSECPPVANARNEDHQDPRAVPDGFEVPEVRTKRYQRPVYRWIFLGSILFACVSLGAVVVVVLL
jgi:hypothetical protein